MINIFSNANFSCFVNTLDSKIRLHSLSVGVTRKQADPLTDAEESREQGLLGDTTTQTLIDVYVA